MRIQSITNVSNANYQAKKVGKNNIQPSFQGYVNGNYYKDEIIALAKKYRYSSTWKDELRRMKSDVVNDVATWHEAIKDQGGALTRGLCALLSFGASEVLVGGMAATAGIINNVSIEKQINEIAKCMDDLNKSS